MNVFVIQNRPSLFYYLWNYHGDYIWLSDTQNSMDHDGNTNGRYPLNIITGTEQIITSFCLYLFKNLTKIENTLFKQNKQKTK